MIRRLFPLVIAACLAGCGIERPIEEHVTLDFGEGDTLFVSVATTYDLDPRSRATMRRVEAAREAALAGRDDWSARFERVAPDADQIVFERKKGVLERSIRNARIPTEELHRVFADLPLTIQVARWERGRELTIYPGTSTRASREQRDEFNTHLNRWSRSAARYFSAIDRLYDYLEEQDQRAPYVFAALFAEKGVDGAPVGVTEREEALLDGVTQEMSAILDQLDADEELQYTLVEEADLIFNPFPGKLSVNVPGDIVAVESFEKTTEREVTVEPIDLAATVSRLHGKWISPDPLALLLLAERSGAELPKAAEVASLERRSTAVLSALEIEAALLEELRRPVAYRVRWID